MAYAGGKKTLLYDAAGNAITSAAPADAIVNADVRGIDSRSLEHSFNGTTWDRIRNNAAFTILASAARTATTSSPSFPTYNARGIWILLKITANPGGGETLTVGLNTTLNSHGMILVASPAAVAGTNPGIFIQMGAAALTDPASMTAAVGAKSTLVIPPSFYLTVTHSASGSWTYSIVGGWSV